MNDAEEIRGGKIPVVKATQAEMRERLGAIMQEAGRKTEFVFEGAPVFFNDTVPPGVLACLGDDPDGMELHGREDSYEKTMADDRMRAATRNMVRVIRRGLRARKVRRQARFN